VCWEVQKQLDNEIITNLISVGWAQLGPWGNPREDTVDCCPGIAYKVRLWGTPKSNCFSFLIMSHED
jgi:hypothetical protein